MTTHWLHFALHTLTDPETIDALWDLAHSLVAKVHGRAKPRTYAPHDVDNGA